MTDYPPVERLLPHSGKMVLLDELIDAGEDYAVCELEVRADGLFDIENHVPAYVGLEYMAQAIAAYSGFQASLRGESVKLGFLLGTRRFESSVGSFSCGQKLRVCVNRQIQGDSGLASFDCEISDAQELSAIKQSARLSVYEPVEAGRYLMSD